MDRIDAFCAGGIMVLCSIGVAWGAWRGQAGEAFWACTALVQTIHLVTIKQRKK